MRIALALALLLAACAPGPGAARPDVLLATTTSLQDSGLLDVLIADFRAATGYRVKAAAVGTGAALAIGAKGDADVIVVHAPKAEREFMAAGNGDRRHLFMHNDFLIVGPGADPAGISGLRSVDALRRIAERSASFISRGDRSGTHLLEMDLWERAGVQPRGSWYVQAATGMGQTLTIASERRAYTLTDRGTFLARRQQLDLRILVANDPPLLNVYHVITVSPRKFSGVNVDGANAFADHLLSKRAQDLIARFGVDKYGEPLFFPDAGKSEADFGH